MLYDHVDSFPDKYNIVFIKDGVLVGGARYILDYLQHCEMYDFKRHLNPGQKGAHGDYLVLEQSLRGTRIAYSSLWIGLYYAYHADVDQFYIASEPNAAELYKMHGFEVLGDLFTHEETGLPVIPLGINLKTTQAAEQFDLLKSYFKIFSDTMHHYYCEEDEEVYNIGDVVNNAYCILEGEATMTIQDSTGAQKRIRHMKPGDIFGTLGVLTGTAQLTCVTADSPLHLMVLTRDEFNQQLHADPDRANKVLDVVSHNMLNLVKFMRDEK